MPFDVVVVGGGLQAALIVLSLFAARSHARVALIEQSSSLGGNHTWSFHAGDLDGHARVAATQLEIAHWPGYDVLFPNLRRHIDRPYASLRSDRLDEAVRAAFAQRDDSLLFLGIAVVSWKTGAVTLADGREIEGHLLIDARGPKEPSDPRKTGYQKFLGQEIELAAPVAPTCPILMDATIPQVDGYRFVYTLPFAPDRVLVEDTYYSDSPRLDKPALRARIAEYLAKQGWPARRVIREETGVLPIPWSTVRPASGLDPLRAGYRGNWFHPVTGYSVPLAGRIANLIAELPAERLEAGLRDLAQETAKQNRFCRWLNWMLFRAFEPEDRWRVLERFHRLPVETIERFYSLSMTRRDRARLVCGRPPAGFSVRKILTGTETHG